MACSVINPEIIDALCDTDDQKRMLSKTPNALSAVFAPDGSILSGPLIDEEGIVYADIDLNRSIELKQMHDIVGHYNRFDIFQLQLNREATQPLHGDYFPGHYPPW